MRRTASASHSAACSRSRSEHAVSRTPATASASSVPGDPPPLHGAPGGRRQAVGGSAGRLGRGGTANFRPTDIVGTPGGRRRQGDVPAAGRAAAAGGAVGPRLGRASARTSGPTAGGRRGRYRRGDGAAVAGRVAGPRLGHRRAVAPAGGGGTGRRRFRGNVGTLTARGGGRRRVTGPGVGRTGPTAKATARGRRSRSTAPR